MPTKRKQHYIVTGVGSFPDDMLRYDRGTIVGRCLVLGKQAFLIEAEDRAGGRWSSFLWSTFPAQRHLPAGNSEQGPVEWKVQMQGRWEKVHVRPNVTS